MCSEPQEISFDFSRGGGLGGGRGQRPSKAANPPKTEINRIFDFLKFIFYFVGSSLFPSISNGFLRTAIDYEKKKENGLTEAFTLLAVCLFLMERNENDEQFLIDANE